MYSACTSSSKLMSIIYFICICVYLYIKICLYWVTRWSYEQVRFFKSLFTWILDSNPWVDGSHVNINLLFLYFFKTVGRNE